MSLESEINRAQMVVNSANHVHAARISDWTAALFTGGPKARQVAMDGVMAATEALLDAQALHADLVHKHNGTTPQGA